MIKSLQAGRGLAALAVVAFHMTVAPAFLGVRESIGAKLSAHGNCGVDFFFVLSGFIIMFVHNGDIGKPGRIGRYLKNRFARIYPIYWILTAVTVLLAVAFRATQYLPANAADWLTTLSLVRVTDIAPPINVAWTLYYEIAFYAVFATLLLNETLGALAFAAWLTLIVVKRQYMPIDEPAGVLQSLVCIAFFVGMAAYWAHSLVDMVGAVLMVVAAALGLGACWTSAGMPPSEFEFRTTICFGLLVAGLAAIETRHRVRIGPLGILGDASFTLYLVHVHVTSVILRAIYKVGRFPPDFVFVAALAGTVAVSLVLYRLLEKPISAAAKRWLTPAPVPALISEERA